MIPVAMSKLSLFNICFCTDNSCKTSFESLLVGWLVVLTGGAAISWMANPFLIISWILLTKNKKAAWVFSFTASVFSISFLRFSVMIADEAGNYTAILSIEPGYWLWLSSCLTTFIGSLIIRIVKAKTYK